MARHACLRCGLDVADAVALDDVGDNVSRHRDESRDCPCVTLEK